MLTESTFRKLIQEIIKNELNEISTSGGAGGYDTPFAFKDTQDVENDKKHSTHEILPFGKESEKEPIQEAKSHYNKFKDSDGRDSAKIGQSLISIAKLVKQAEHDIVLCCRLKNDKKLSSGEFWKRSHDGLARLESSLIKMLTKVRELKR